MDTPLAYFLTWTVYGTHLQGDDRGWWRRGDGERPSQPLLADWHRDRLTHPIMLLDGEARQCIDLAIEDHCQRRGWKLWASSIRTNHAHVVLSAADATASKVRDQLKANGTGKLRKIQTCWLDRPVWTVKGWCEYIDTDDDLDAVVLYTSVAQDRKHRDQLADGR